MITLYRLTDPSDSISDTSDKIQFNEAGPSEKKPTKDPHAYCLKLRRMPTTGIGNNQGVGQDLADIQATGNVEDVFVLEGFITARNAKTVSRTGAKSGTLIYNELLWRLRTWKEDPTVNGNWREGRFGLQDDGDGTKDIVPVNGSIGLMLQEISYESVFAKQFEMITIKLKVSRGSQTVSTTSTGTGTGTGGGGTPSRQGYTTAGSAASGSITHTITSSSAITINETLVLTRDVIVEINTGAFTPPTISLSWTVRNDDNDRHRIRIRFNGTQAFSQRYDTGSTPIRQTYTRQSGGRYSL